jgi:hypothetical protein
LYRVKRFVGLPALLLYVAVLCLAAWPVPLRPRGFPDLLHAYSNGILSLVGSRPGLDVFKGAHPPRDVPHLSCFRIRATGGPRPVTVYDDMALCGERKVYPVRDWFRIYQHRKLTPALVHLDLGGQADLKRMPLPYLFVFTDYYCHTPQARSADATRVEIELDFVTWNYDSGEVAHHTMSGFRDCKSTGWVVR